MINVQNLESAERSSDYVIDQRAQLIRNRCADALRGVVKIGTDGAVLAMELTGYVAGGGIRGIAKGSGALIRGAMGKPLNN